MFIASLAPCAACAQSDADTVFTVRSFRSNFFSAFDTRTLSFVSVPIEKQKCADEALARLPWRDAFIEALLLDWGKKKDEYARIRDYVRKTIGDMYVPLAFEMARAEDGGCSIRTFFTSSNEVEKKLKQDDQERLRNWLPSVHARSVPVHAGAAQRVSAAAAELSQERERSQGLERDLTAAREEIRKLKDAQGGATQQVSAVSAELSQERERLTGLDRDLAAAREEIRKLKDAQGGATQQVSAAAAEFSRERGRSQGLERDLTAAREEIRKLRDAQGGATRQVSAVAAELSQQRERSQELDRDLAAAREEIRKLKDAQGTATQQVSSVAAELTQQRGRSQQLDRELAAAHEEMGTLAAHQRESAEQAALAVRALEQERSRSQRLDHDLAAAREEMRRVKAARAGIATTHAAASRPTSLQNDADGGAAHNASERTVLARAVPDSNAEAVATPSSDAPPRADAASPPRAEDKLLARAHALVLQGNIDGARLWLERAIETGSARAAFDLAQTYDPHVLLVWKTYGVRGDVAKARDLYSRAYSRGIAEAKKRIEALK
jgi:predicted  nucleic acid-binding Zn-ribbon protein